MFIQTPFLHLTQTIKIKKTLLENIILVITFRSEFFSYRLFVNL